ncbi:MAG: hypothetical protein WBC44_11130, partial [Planctomycetaceae bacterium]
TPAPKAVKPAATADSPTPKAVKPAAVPKPVAPAKSTNGPDRPAASEQPMVVKKVRRTKPSE